MDRTKLLDRLAGDREERILLARVLDLLETAQRRNIPTHTPFLSPHERSLTEQLIREVGHPAAEFVGGYEEAERRVCVFLPDWMEEVSGEEVGLCAIRAVWKDGRPLTHRDFLGALMGMGIVRDKVGDILVGDGTCDILLLEEVRPFLLQSMESAGRSRLTLTEISLSEVTVPEVQVKVVRDTVAALRLDAVAAAGFSASRSKMADRISAGQVNVNWQECVKPDAAVKEGDVISCRGLGKCRLTQVLGASRKGRTMIVMERYQ